MKYCNHKWDIITKIEKYRAYSIQKCVKCGKIYPNFMERVELYEKIFYPLYDFYCNITGRRISRSNEHFQKWSIFFLELFGIWYKDNNKMVKSK